MATKRKKVGRKKARIRPVIFNIKLSLHPRIDSDVIEFLMQAPEKGMAAHVIRRIRSVVSLEVKADGSGDNGIFDAWGVDEG